MFQVKICGITTVSDAQAVVQAGADAIGLNFYPRSPRCISQTTAHEIISVLPTGIVKVGLFVNAPANQICRYFDQLKLDLIQLHGDEPPEFLTELGGRPVMRAFRVAKDGIKPILNDLQRCSDLGVAPQIVLLDASSSEGYGGTGKTADWNVAKDYAGRTGLPPLVLAGGLTPENVAEAIGVVRPAAVDTASGVESQPGRKDPAVVAAFVAAARAAYAQQKK